MDIENQLDLETKFKEQIADWNNAFNIGFKLGEKTATHRTNLLIQVRLKKAFSQDTELFNKIISVLNI